MYRAADCAFAAFDAVNMQIAVHIATVLLQGGGDNVWLSLLVVQFILYKIRVIIVGG